MTININVPELRELKPRILVLGVGGAGGNAINGMIEAGLQGVEFVAVNTDTQDLKMNKAEAKIQLGSNLTKGLGAGGKTDLGQASADESLNEIINFIQEAIWCLSPPEWVVALEQAHLTLLQEQLKNLIFLQ